MVREQLEDDIIEGRLLPGAQLHADEIAASLNMSRTPVREALQQLESSGLVEVFPKRGTYVAGPRQKNGHRVPLKVSMQPERNFHETQFQSTVQRASYSACA